MNNTYEFRTKLFDEHGNESPSYGGDMDVIVDKIDPGALSVAVSKPLIADTDADVQLTITLPSGTVAGDKIQLYKDTNLAR